MREFKVRVEIYERYGDSGPNKNFKVKANSLYEMFKKLSKAKPELSINYSFMWDAEDDAEYSAMTDEEFAEQFDESNGDGGDYFTVTENGKVLIGGNSDEDEEEIDESKNNKMKNLKEATEQDLQVGTVYKIFDTTNNGNLVHSQAKYTGNGAEGFTFSLLNQKGRNVSYKDISNFSIMPTKVYAKVESVSKEMKMLESVTGKKVKLKENYYQDEISKIGANYPHICLQDDDGNKTKWLPLNEESIPALIFWLNQAR